MTVDNTVGSPYQDRVYVTWTEFAANGSAFIYEAYSSDYGETTSTPVLVSRTTPLCSQTFGAGTKATTGESSNCNENQFSQPFTGKDGALYVAYANFNNTASSGLRDDGGPGGAGPNAKTAQAAPKDNHNQILLSKSTDGGRSFSAPVKAADTTTCRTARPTRTGRMPAEPASRRRATPTTRSSGRPTTRPARSTPRPVRWW